MLGCRGQDPSRPQSPSLAPVSFLLPLSALMEQWGEGRLQPLSVATSVLGSSRAPAVWGHLPYLRVLNPHRGAGWEPARLWQRLGDGRAIIGTGDSSGEARGASLGRAQRSCPLGADSVHRPRRIAGG